MEITMRRLSLACLLALARQAPRWRRLYTSSRPIKFLVPFSPGSGTDIIARTVGEAMSKNIGQPVVVENKPGRRRHDRGRAGRARRGRRLHRADPFVGARAESGDLPEPAVRHAARPDRHHAARVDAERAGGRAGARLEDGRRPGRGGEGKAGQLNYASAGIGSATHMNAEKFRLQAGIEAQHVPFKGTPEALTDVIGGRNDWFFAPLSAALPLVREGKLQALAVSTPTRAAVLPAVPTSVEAGVPGSDYIFWVAMIVSSATPPAVMQRLHDEALKVLADRDVKERLAGLGAEPFPLAQDAFNAFIRVEVDAAAKIARAANLKGS
jgi:tripartite-type tricarboxylate transporter receptor subunit TctC